MGDAKPRIVYILPFYDEGTDTHLFYNYKLIKESAKQAEIFVIVEKADITLFDDRKKVSYALGASVYTQKFKFPPLRFLELVRKCFMLRVSGYRNFYIHYSYYGALAAWLVSKLRRLNLHKEVQPPKVFYWNRGMPWLYKRGWFEEKVFQFILRNTILVTGPEFLAKEYQERYGVKEYRVLSNWVDTERFLPSRKPMAQASQDLAQSRHGGTSREIRQQANIRVLAKLGAEAYGKKIVLFVHHLSKRKGADLIPEIAKGFGGDVLFLMVGDGPEFGNFKLNNIKLLGRVSNAEIIKYFWVSAVFLMPSREEGSPHVLLEAMASGTPFVASDVGGVRELIPQGLEQFLCESEDVKCFQNKIKTLLSDKALYDKASAACLAHAKNFDISRGVREFISLFK